MLFGNNKKDKDVRLTDKQYKDLVGGMSKKERREFDRRQEQLRRDREDDRLDALWKRYGQNNASYWCHEYASAWR